jgi:hypothetical protein
VLQDEIAQHHLERELAHPIPAAAISGRFLVVRDHQYFVFQELAQGEAVLQAKHVLMEISPSIVAHFGYASAAGAA